MKKKPKKIVKSKNFTMRKKIIEELMRYGMSFDSAYGAMTKVTKGWKQ